nr:NADH-quinone oxidoreductase subunit A [Gammaproteobacteria bacterium]
LTDHAEHTRASQRPTANVPTGTTDLRWTVNYYLVAILFVIFDMEAVFLYIWAAVVLETGWLAFWGTSMFILILLVALAYEWRMGVLEWGNKLKFKQHNNSGQFGSNSFGAS